jgi:hypothetical protein
MVAGFQLENPGADLENLAREFVTRYCGQASHPLAGAKIVQIGAANAGGGHSNPDGVRRQVARRCHLFKAKISNAV